jgi:hypothetical protein
MQALAAMGGSEHVLTLTAVTERCPDTKCELDDLNGKVSLHFELAGFHTPERLDKH